MNSHHAGVQRWDAVFRTLAAAPRRQIIDSLLHAPADRELLLPDAAIPPDGSGDSRQFRLSLHHNHLPMMTRHGFVAWATDPFRVWRGEMFNDVAAVMKALQSHHEYPAALREACDRLPDAGAQP